MAQAQIGHTTGDGSPGVSARTRPLRLDDGRGRVDDRLRHLYRLGRHGPPAGQPRMAAGGMDPHGVLTITAALSYRGARGDDAACGRSVTSICREAYSPLWGFLYGWTLFAVIQTGTIAAVGVAFARFLGILMPWVGEPLPHQSNPPLHGICRLAVHGPAGWHSAHPVPDLDQHARASLWKDHSEHLHDDEDRRAARTDRGRHLHRAQPDCRVDEFRRPLDVPAASSRSRPAWRRPPPSASSSGFASPKQARSSPRTRGTTSRSRLARSRTHAATFRCRWPLERCW